MVHVILRSQKVVTYNQADEIIVEEGTITLRRCDAKSDTRWLVARIPLDIVERAEFSRPCNVRKTKIRKGKDY